MVQGGPQGDLPERLAGRGRREPRRADVSRPEPLSRRLACRRSCGASTTRCSAPTRSSGPRARRPDDWFAPIVADAEAGFGGPLNAFELMKAMIEAGAAGVHFEDQLASEKKCGHLGGKVLVPTAQFIRTLVAARLAADVCDVPTVLVARTDAHSAKLLTSDVDERDQRVPHRRAHARGLLPRRERPRLGDRPRRSPTRRTPTSSGARPRRPTSTRHASSPRPSTRSFPGKLSRTTARRRSTGRSTSTTTRSPASSSELGAMGYKFQFVTLAGFHALNAVMFELARGYREEGMTAYVAPAGARVRAREPRATRRRATSARSAPATSTRWPRRSRAASPRRSRSRARPRKRSSTRR